MTNIPTNEEEAKKLSKRGSLFVIVGIALIFTGAAFAVGIVFIIIGLHQKETASKFLNASNTDVKPNSFKENVDNIGNNINKTVDNIGRNVKEIIKGKSETILKCEYCGSKYKSANLKCPNCGGTAK